jgi:hypothetical protein
MRRGTQSGLDWLMARPFTRTIRHDHGAAWIHWEPCHPRTETRRMVGAVNRRRWRAILRVIGRERWKLKDQLPL